MSIKRDDLDAGRVDFSEVATGKRLPLIHPGEILRDDFLQPMKISVYALAQAIKVPRSRVNDIVLGRRGITADTALRLARYFGTTPDFWINLQARHDLETADRKLRRRIEREIVCASRAVRGGACATLSQVLLRSSPLRSLAAANRSCWESLPGRSAPRVHFWPRRAWGR